MRLLFTKSNWEVGHLPVDEFCDRVAAAGFDAAEICLSARRESPAGIRAALARHALKLVAHIGTDGATPAAHAESLRTHYLRALESEPLFVNSHTGRDHFSFNDSLRIFEAGQKLVARHGVPLRHETHRGRTLFSAPATFAFLQTLPGLELTADFSHWVCVHESDLGDQPEAMTAALVASRHLHARVGFDEGPQVSDPRNPAHAAWLQRFTEWWQTLVSLRADAGSEWLTITPEFGPPPYTPLNGISTDPVSDAWEMNVWMMAYLKRTLRA